LIMASIFFMFALILISGWERRRLRSVPDPCGASKFWQSIRNAYQIYYKNFGLLGMENESNVLDVQLEQSAS